MRLALRELRRRPGRFIAATDGLSRVAQGDYDGDMDQRSYGIGAQILADLGIRDMVLLTNAHRNVVALDGYGLNIVGEQMIPD